MPAAEPASRRPRPRLTGMLASAALVALIAWLGFPRLQRLEAERRAEGAYGTLMACLCGPELDCRDETIKGRWRALASITPGQRLWPRSCAAAAVELVAALHTQQRTGGCAGERCAALVAQAIRVRDALDPADELHVLALGALMDAAADSELTLTVEPAPLVVPRPQALLSASPRYALSEPLQAPPEVRPLISGFMLMLRAHASVQLCQLDMRSATVSCRRQAVGAGVRPLLDLSGRCLLLHQSSSGRLLVVSESGATRHAEAPDMVLSEALCEGSEVWLRGNRDGAELLLKVLPERGEPIAVTRALPLLTAHGILQAAAAGPGVELRSATGELRWSLPLSAEQVRAAQSCPAAQTLVLGGTQRGHTTDIAVVQQIAGAATVATTSVTTAHYGVSCVGDEIVISWLDGASEHPLPASRNPGGRAVSGRYLSKRQRCVGGSCIEREQQLAFQRSSPSSDQLLAPFGDGVLALWLSPLGDVRSLLQEPGSAALPWPLLSAEADDGFVWDGAMTQLYSVGDSALLLLTDRERRLHALILNGVTSAGIRHVSSRYVSALNGP